MKICVVAPHFYPETGGMETNILITSRELVKKGFDIEIHTSNRTTTGKILKNTDEINGIKIFRYRPIFQFGYYTTLIKPKIGKFDVLHLHAYGYYTHNSLISKFKGKPIVFTPHHGVSMPRKGGFVDEQFHKMYEKSFSKNLKYISRIIMMTEAEKKWYLEHGMPDEKLVVIPSGVDDNAFMKVASDKILAKHNILKDNYLLYLGRLHEEKSIDNLIIAFEKNCSEYPELRLVIAGPNDGAEKELKTLTKLKKIEDKVIFAGRVDEKEKLTLLGNCAIFILPSKFEAEGVVLLEAMAQDRAVVASKVGGVPYIINHNKTGMLYHYGDINDLTKNIIDLLDNPKKRAVLGKAARDYVYMNFRWKTIIDKMEKLYQDIL